MLGQIISQGLQLYYITSVCVVEISSSSTSIYEYEALKPGNLAFQKNFEDIEGTDTAKFDELHKETVLRNAAERLKL